MTKTEIESEIKRLREAYWNGNCETPDVVYDTLVEQLRSIDPCNALLTTPEHGDGGLAKIEHKVPMLSLQKVYKKDDLMKWIDSVSRSDDEEFLVQPKYDGISCHCQNGIYSTRGDGNFGENITGVCLAMCDTEYGDDCDKTDFYGEIVIRNSDFATFYKNVKRENGETFKTQRNAVAGILNADDYGFYRKQKAVITLVDYGKYSFSMKKSEADAKWDVIRSAINALDYPMDGIVVKIADKDWYEKQGVTSHHPKGAMAFKFENSSASTFLKSIEWGMGKEYITATAVFQSVTLGGVKVSRAFIPMKSRTLPCVMNGDFNYDAILKVERAGDVIPHITEVSYNPAGGTPFSIDKCPFCGGEIEVTESGVRCLNPSCRRKSVHRLYDALVQLGAKDIGEATVSDLCDKLGAKDEEIGLRWWLSHTTTLAGIDDIEKLDGYGMTSATQIVSEMAVVCRNATVAQFIASLGIPNVGIKIGRVIEANYGTVENFADKADFYGLCKLEGIGDVMANRIVDWLHANGSEMLALAKMFFKFAPPAQPVQKQASSKGTVCFTGKMKFQRSEMQRIARQNGYEPLDSVTKGLDTLVVADDVDLTSSKCVKAQKYGTTIVRESDFLANCK